MDYYEIGQRIRARRKALGLSQEQLAELVDISVTHMSHIETGNTKLSLPVLVALAAVLHVTTDHLLFGQMGAEQDDAVAEITAVLNTCSKLQLCIIKSLIGSVVTAFALCENADTDA